MVPDDSPLCANAARSMALAGADVALVFGARCAGRCAVLCCAVLCSTLRSTSV